jgi:hypothetical protein
VFCVIFCCVSLASAAAAATTSKAPVTTTTKKATTTTTKKTTTTKPPVTIGSQIKTSYSAFPTVLKNWLNDYVANVQAVKDNFNSFGIYQLIKKATSRYSMPHLNISHLIRIQDILSVITYNKLIVLVYCGE